MAGGKARCYLQFFEFQAVEKYKVQSFRKSTSQPRMMRKTDESIGERRSVS